MGSTRLPGKVLMKVGDKPLLKTHLDRLSLCKEVDEIVVATTTNKDDDYLALLSDAWCDRVYRGSENDVLDRYFQAVKDLRPDWVVRVTSDCPLIDPSLVDQVILYVMENDKDYGSNTLVERYPDGQDIEVFKFSALKSAWQHAVLKSDREHVTPYLKRNSDFNGEVLFSALNFPCKEDYSKIRMTVDEPFDFELVSILIDKLGDLKEWKDYADYIIVNNLMDINSHIIRNEGFLKSLNKD